MVILFITCISTSGDADQPKIGTKKAKAMVPGTRHYERVANADKHQAPDRADHEVNSIGRCVMDTSAETCCAGKTGGCYQQQANFVM